MEAKRKGPKHDQVLRTTKQKTYKTIISQNGNKTMEKVGRILGMKVDKEKYRKAYRYARHKLDWQNKRYGTNHGDDYLEKLILETYRQQEFQEETMKIARRAYA